MEIEAVADAWYVWIGVAVVSVGIAGIVLSLPTQPPPDASGAANTAERVAASEYGTSAVTEHDATDARIGTRQISLRNDGGTDHASVAFASLTPVDRAEGKTRDAAEALLSGETPAQFVAEDHRFDSEVELSDAFRELRLEVDQQGSHWQRTHGTLRLRSVRIAGETVVLIESR